MENEITYEQTIELERNVKLKNLADEIYANFKKNIKLTAENYRGNGKFVFWQDQYNATYFIAKENHIEFLCEFLHETYRVQCTPSGIFDGLKRKDRGIDHLASAVRDK